MRLAVLKERRVSETRVAATPETVKRLLALGLTVVVCLTLTPALLILLAKYRPRSFAGLTAPSSGFWDDMGHRVLARPILRVQRTPHHHDRAAHFGPRSSCA